MEETMGKRIVTHRKRLGLTQDKLAETLGVTAQAVSKWENDQTCPDITMLPRLAEVFGITTDELLGLNQKPVSAPAAREKDEESEGIHVHKGDWEFQWDGGRKGGLCFAVWVLLCGGLLLVSKLLESGVGLWEICWTTGFMVFGLAGMGKRVSVFGIGCFLFGGYCLADAFDVLPFSMGKELLLPIFLVVFGLSLLLKALRRSKKPTFRWSRGSTGKLTSDFSYGEDSFSASTSFGENTQIIHLPCLKRGTADVSFGEMVIDLRGCEEIANGCKLDLSCSFGDLEVLVPRSCRVEYTSNTAFANVDVIGHSAPEAAAVICAECDVSFGNIEIRYV